MACKAISRESFQILGLGFFSILLLKKKSPEKCQWGKYLLPLSCSSRQICSTVKTGVFTQCQDCFCHIHKWERLNGQLYLSFSMINKEIMLSRIRWRNTGCLAPVLPNTNTCGELTTAAIFHLCVLNYDKKNHHLLQTSMAPLRGLFLFALQSCALLPNYLLSPPLHIKYACLSKNWQKTDFASYCWCGGEASLHLQTTASPAGMEKCQELF